MNNESCIFLRNQRDLSFHTNYLVDWCISVYIFHIYQILYLLIQQICFLFLQMPTRWWCVESRIFPKNLNKALRITLWFNETIFSSLHFFSSIHWYSLPNWIEHFSDFRPGLQHTCVLIWQSGEFTTISSFLLSLKNRDVYFSKG